MTDRGFDSKTRLNDQEETSIHRLIKKLIRGILDREPDPTKRVILRNELASLTDYYAAMEMATQCEQRASKRKPRKTTK